MQRVFRDRADAGKQLAKALAHYRGSDAVVMAIPRGGIPIGAAVAHELGLQWSAVIVRKLPIPWNPEAGFGAVTSDGSVVLNEPMVRGLLMRREHISEVIEHVMAEMEHTAREFQSLKPELEVADRSVILVDDGLASGYTMLAAISSLRDRDAARVVAAAPVASKSAADLVRPAADECVFEIVSPSIPFAVADYYLQWHDLTDDEVISYLTSTWVPGE